MAAPLDAQEYERWRQSADTALRSAELQREGRIDNWACFASEQAAQLALKSLLHGIGAGAWGHDLEELADRLVAAGITPPAGVRRSIKELARHYIPTRYPDALPGGEPSQRYDAADSKLAIGQAKQVLEFVDSAWEALGDA